LPCPKRTRNATGRSSNARCKCHSRRKVTTPTVMVKMITVRLSVARLKFSSSTPSFPKTAVRPAKNVEPSANTYQETTVSFFSFLRNSCVPIPVPQPQDDAERQYEAVPFLQLMQAHGDAGPAMGKGRCRQYCDSEIAEQDAPRRKYPWGAPFHVSIFLSHSTSCLCGKGVHP
jgi:hypothetical protein